MEFIVIEEKIAIYLDHCVLIDELYNKNIGVTSDRYALKEELFHFTSKSLQESPANTTRKRKRNNGVSPESQELQSRVAKYLQKLGPNFATPKPVHMNIPRYWEESTQFPTFNGVNKTGRFQEVRIESQTYLIPPQCTFFNNDISNLAHKLHFTQKYDLIIMDPPWRNKYIRRVKRVRQELGYHMLYNDQLADMPIEQLIHKDSLIAIWCTNSLTHQDTIRETFLPRWNLQLLHTLKWFKLNIHGELISTVKGDRQKQPYEILYLACHKDVTSQKFTSLLNVEFLLSQPSVIHSHKPPLLPWLRKFLPDKPMCLEIFARYLQPHFTSFGLEVLKLMDKRLYTKPDNAK